MKWPYVEDMYDIYKIRVQMDVFNRNFAYSLINQGLHLDDKWKTLIQNVVDENNSG